MKLIQVTSWLWRGSQPWSDADWDLVEREGVRTVIKLNDPKTGNGDAGWSKRGRTLLTYHIPDDEAQSELTEKTREDLWHAVECVGLEKCTSPVLVHCTEGVDRTGFVIAAWRVLAQGWTPLAAYEEWVAMGSHRYDGLELEWACRFGSS